MHHRVVRALGALLLLFAPLSWAGFAQVSPAQGFTSAGSTVMYRAAANDVIAGGIARVAAGATLDVGGRLVTFPVAARYAANAALFAARGAWPLLVAGLAAPVVLDWLQGRGLFVKDGVVFKHDPLWCAGPAACTMYYATVQGVLYKALTGQGVCSQLEGVYNSGGGWSYKGVTYAGSVCSFKKRYSNGAEIADYFGVGSYQTSPSGADAGVVVALPEFEQIVSSSGLPDNVPTALPVPLPVEQPVLNPSADPVPVPQPLVVPQGSPIPVPNTNPQQYRQPILKITPTPSPAYPWQVNLDPQDVVNEDPNGIKQPQAQPPAGSSSAPSSTDLCTLHPEVLACQVPNLNVPDDDTLKTEDRGVTSIQPDSGWGGSGSCPAARHVVVQGRDIPIPFDLFCQYMSGIRPVVIAMAWLAAAFIFVGGVREA